jgi:P27 family predicted phage terminase small subunit
MPIDTPAVLVEAHSALLVTRRPCTSIEVPVSIGFAGLLPLNSGLEVHDGSLTHEREHYGQAQSAHASSSARANCATRSATYNATPTAGATATPKGACLDAARCARIFAWGSMRSLCMLRLHTCEICERCGGGSFLASKSSDIVAVVVLLQSRRHDFFDMTKRLSNTAKLARGTFRPDRKPKPTALDRLKTAPRAPATLSDRAKVEWGPLARACVELGVLTGADLRALELLAETLATEAELREILKTEGLTIAGAGENSKAHPACKLLESTRNQAARLLADFGLTPKGRLGVDVRPPSRENRFSVNGKSADRYFEPKLWERAK